MTKQIQFLSYEYPGTIEVLIGTSVYTYRSSAFWCDRLIWGLKKGWGFRAFNPFREQAELVGKEEKK
jgi:hypothetical protein